MNNNDILSLAEEYQQKYAQLRQISLFPNISTELLNCVNEAFPEFNHNIETSLLFYTDGDNKEGTFRWLMLSNTRLYYSLLYYPDDFNVLNAIPLQKIKSFKIKCRRSLEMAVNPK